jgi:HD superfamily phosphohydrolase
MNLPIRIAAYNVYVDAQATAAEIRVQNAAARLRRQEELDAMTPEQRQEIEANAPQNRKRKKTDEEIALMTQEERAEYNRANFKKPRHKKKTQEEVNALTERERIEYNAAERRCAKDRERYLRKRTRV